ncbi:AEC family transporter [Motiliproteus coralliicola]|uniref:AEC family transporter n=1 Tax=Motiliproteus coralliicola TaxID=2283196 RepID=A0A369WE29_9GAMM|nr:AEC family transporter [Motiliproteus coralliicola]RDE19907.1 AEC family transporter [Motiliproteus coralliicola]
MTATSWALTERIFLTVFPLFVIVLCGYLYGRRHRPDIEFANRANMDIFIPALIFHSMATQTFPLSQYQDLALGGLLVVLGSGLLLYPIARLLKLNLKTFLPPMMFNNTGNMGIPLLVLAFGEQVLPAAVILFIVENTLHMSVGAMMLDRNTRLLNLLKMPMIIATIAGISWSLSGWQLPKAAALPIEMLGQISIPLMLFTLGIRIVEVGFKHWQQGVIGALLCPLSGILVVLIIQPWLQLSQEQFSLLLVFGALPPAVLNYMMAERYQQQPEQVASIVLLGNIGALLTIPPVLAFVL